MYKHLFLIKTNQKLLLMLKLILQRMLKLLQGPAGTFGDVVCGIPTLAFHTGAAILATLTSVLATFGSRQSAGYYKVNCGKNEGYSRIWNIFFSFCARPPRIE